jgi:hypothetical protein
MLHPALRRAAGLLAVLLALPVAAQDAPRPAGEPVRLAGDEASAFSRPSWSPDGSLIALTRPGYEGLWVIAPDGSGLRQVSGEPAAGFGFAWSEDSGALLTRIARFEGPLRLNAVVVYDVETAEAQPLTEFRPHMSALPQWSGSRVLLPGPAGVEVLEAERPGVAARPAPAGPVFIAGEDGLTALTLRDGAARSEAVLQGLRVINAVPSPDGRLVAFEVLGGNLHVAHADGTGLVDLGPGHRPAWSPDSEWVAFMRTEDDGHHFTASDLYAARADGSETVALTATPDRLEMNPSWSPDGARLAFDEPSEGAVYLLPLAR